MPAYPETIGRYRVVRRPARGGTGTLCLARDAELDRLVGVRLMSDAGGHGDDELHARFARASRAAAFLGHINIVTVFEGGHLERRPFLVMETIPGASRTEMTRNPAPVSRRPGAGAAQRLQVAARTASEPATARRTVQEEPHRGERGGIHGSAIEPSWRLTRGAGRGPAGHDGGAPEAPRR